MERLEEKLYFYIKEKYKNKSEKMGRKANPLPSNFPACLLRWYESTSINPYNLDQFACDVGIKKSTLIHVIKRYERMLLEKY